MGSLSGDFESNVLAQIIEHNFNSFSFGWLKFSLSEDQCQIKLEMLDIIRGNIGRKTSQDFRKKRNVGVDLSYVTHSLTLNYVLKDSSFSKVLRYNIREESTSGLVWHCSCCSLQAEDTYGRCFY